MSQQPSFYLTTAIDYVNAAPHIGHAYEKIATDVMARFYRLMGREVFFLTGTDEHGIKVEKTALQQGLAPQAYTDQIAQKFQDAWHHLNLSYDRFIRTTEPDHTKVVQAIWTKMMEKGDLYKASYQGLYCAGCETFLTERDLTEDGRCQVHLSTPEPVEEENYFFRLSHYKEKIRAHIEAHPDFIQPAFRAQEILNVLDDLEDISVSRSIHSVTWGIPVPNDPDQRIYVWIDALSNYLTGVGYLIDSKTFNQFWPCDVHVIGKDILRFHALYWPAMLMSLELDLPKCIFAHGFITINDSKISKSLGNGISPLALMEQFELPNPDPIRYYLMTTATFGNDGNYSDEDFKLKVNADLANNLGNLLNRTVSMTGKYFNGIVPDPEWATDAFDPTKPALLLETQTSARAVQEAYERFSFNTVADILIGRVDEANRLINQQEPWNLFKQEKHLELARLLYTVLETVRQVAVAFYPLTPQLSENILGQLGLANIVSTLHWNDLENKALPPGTVTQPNGPILPRLDSEILGAAKKAKV
jgi:methionyl-tRNA synthetase